MYYQIIDTNPEILTYLLLLEPLLNSFHLTLSTDPYYPKKSVMYSNFTGTAGTNKHTLFIKMQANNLINLTDPKHIWQEYSA